MEIMEQKEIIEGSKIIAKYLGWKYVPSNDLQGFNKAGWFEVHPRETDIQEADVERYDSSDGSVKNLKVTVDFNMLKYNEKLGWNRNNEYFYRFICRAHTHLRFYNDFNLLVDVITKIETENPEYVFEIRSNETVCKYNNSANTWTVFNHHGKKEMLKNTFKVIIQTIKHLKYGNIQ